jgi:pyruvate/2-oxoglutarate/acetoin dehydrogenase E1 component
MSFFDDYRAAREAFHIGQDTIKRMQEAVRARTILPVDARVVIDALRKTRNLSKVHEAREAATGYSIPRGKC